MMDAEMPSPVPLEQQVDTPVNGGSAVDAERLRYLTRLLGSQQGPSLVLLGALLFSESSSVLGWSIGWRRVAWLVVTVLFAAYRLWIPRYYQRRFGSVQPQEPSAKWFGLFLLALVLLLVVGQPLAHYLDPKVAAFADLVHLKISDPHHQINLTAFLLWIGLSLSCLWHIRSWELPRLYFIFGGIVAFSSIAIFGVLHPDARQDAVWKVLNDGGLGLSLIVLGLFDHFSLLLMLPKKVAEGDDE